MANVEFKQRLIPIGTSKGIIIPSFFIAELGVKKGEKLLVKLSKVRK